MNLKQYFIPIKEKRIKDSKFNKEIEVVRFSGALRLDMGGLTQSGEVIERIWSSGFKNLLPRDFVPKKILVLGFGGGSVAKVISKKWNMAKITGVEIDPAVVEIAREMFEVDKNENLLIINDDAATYVSNLKKDFDLIIVDCYLGDKFPKSLESLDFYEKLLRTDGVVLVNRLFWGDYKKQALDLRDKLGMKFEIKSARTPSNYLIRVMK